jgi:hypothetical protein
LPVDRNFDHADRFESVRLFVRGQIVVRYLSRGDRSFGGERNQILGRQTLPRKDGLLRFRYTVVNGAHAFFGRNAYIHIVFEHFIRILSESEERYGKRRYVA